MQREPGEVFSFNGMIFMSPLSIMLHIEQAAKAKGKHYKTDYCIIHRLLLWMNNIADCKEPKTGKQAQNKIRPVDGSCGKYFYDDTSSNHELADVGQIFCKELVSLRSA